MNIDDLTIGQLKEIIRQAEQMGLTKPQAETAPQAETEPHPFLGHYVICRCSAAGVHAGTLESYDSATGTAILRSSRRLWYWKARKGVALSGVAQYGIAAGSKVDVQNPLISLANVCEIIPCTRDAGESIHDYAN